METMSTTRASAIQSWIVVDVKEFCHPEAKPKDLSCAMPPQGGIRFVAKPRLYKRSARARPRPPAGWCHIFISND